MSVTSVVYKESCFVYTTCTGLLTREALINYQDAVWQTPEIYGFNELIDFTQADSGAITFDDLVVVAKNAVQLKSLAPGSKAAFVLATEEAAVFVRFYCKMREILPGRRQRQVKRMYVVDEALEWLDISDYDSGAHCVYSADSI